VIATGGGCVKRRENVRALKRNGTVVYIDRPLEKLIIGEGRPLSSSKDALERLFVERRGLYEGYADVHADGSGEPREVTREIIKALTKKGN
jgi:shikimate dehydrogenase